MATYTETTDTIGPPTAEAPEQLALLLASDRPLQFRLDRRTRELGLAQIAAIRRQLAQRAAQASA
jgi:hypothetical protein